MLIATIDALYEYFDQLVCNGTDDQLFVSSYLRGFVSMAAAGQEAESQLLTSALAADIDQQLAGASDELNETDHQLVIAFWQELRQYFTC